MSIPVSVVVWIQEDSDLPTGYLNARGQGGPFPVIDLDGAKLQGLTGADPVRYLRRLSEVASRLADELVAAKAAAAAAAAVAL